MEKISFYIVSLVFFSLKIYAGTPTIYSFENLQNAFIENQGQLKDQSGRLNEDVNFIYANNQFHLQLRERGFSYEFLSMVKTPGRYPESGKNIEATDPPNDSINISTARIDAVLKGANSLSRRRGLGKSDTYYNYYLNTLPNGGITRVASYHEVVYENIYNGIDLVFKTSAKQGLQYEFIVHPGADPKQIQIEYHGASSIQVDQSGNLELKDQLGEIRETGLCAYLLRNKKSVPCKLQLKQNTISFNLPTIRDQAMVIDPNIVWGTYYGGENNENIYPKIALNKSGDVVLTGTTASLTSIATTGAYQATFGGQTDAFIANFTTDGELTWATYFGGPQGDTAGGVTIDQENNIIVSGDAESLTGIATAGAYQQMNAGGDDGFIAKFTSAGIIEWSTYFGAKQKDQLRNVTCDSAGNIYAAGITKSPSGIATPGAYQENYGGLRDMLLVKFSSVGKLLWATYYGGEGEDRPHGITTDLNGNVLVEGTVESTTGIASASAFQQQYGGHTDACLAKFDPDGQLLWGTYYGGPREDHGRFPMTDASGNIYVTGFTNDTTAFATKGAYQEKNAGGNDAFITKFSPSGNRIWGSYYGGKRGEQFETIAIDKQSNLYLCGSAESDSLATPGAFQTELSDTIWGDGLLVKMDSSGNRIWATYFGGEGRERIYDVTTDSEGFVYFALYDSSSILPVSPWVFQTHRNGGTDLAIYKFFQGESCYDYNEPNESLSFARLINTVTDSSVYGYNGSISSSADEDWYQINVKPDTNNIKIELSDLTRNYDLQLFDPKGNIVEESTNPGIANETLILNKAPKAKYYIHVYHDPSQFDSLNCYRLLVLNSTDTIKIITNFSDLENRNTGLVVSPNPTIKQLQLSFESKTKGDVNIVIYNLMDQVIKSENLQTVEGKLSAVIDLPDLPSGIYLLKMKQGQQVFIKRVIIIN